MANVFRAPRPIPDPNLLRPEIGQRQTTPTFFLRGTPPIFTVLNVGGSNTNQGMEFRAAQIPDYRQFIPETIYVTRFASKGVRTPSLLVTLEVSVVGEGALGVVTPAIYGKGGYGSDIYGGVADGGFIPLFVTTGLSTVIQGVGTVTGGIVRSLRALFVSIAGLGTVRGDQAGGTIGPGDLSLDPEDPSDLLLLIEEIFDDSYGNAPWGDAPYGDDRLSLTEELGSTLPLTPG